MSANPTIAQQERWIAETRNGQTVGWLVLDASGQIVRVVRYS